MIYLDNHSTTPVDKRVLNKMLPYFSIKYNNPHSQPTKHNSSIIKDIVSSNDELSNKIKKSKNPIIILGESVLAGRAGQYVFESMKKFLFDNNFINEKCN